MSNCPKIQQQQQQNCQGAGVSDQLGGDSGVIGSSRPGFFRSLINQFFHLLFIVLSDPGYLKNHYFSCYLLSSFSYQTQQARIGRPVSHIGMESRCVLGFMMRVGLRVMTFHTILWYFYGSKFDANIDTNTIYDISTNTNISF